MTEVKLRALCKRYPNGFEAVKGVDLDIRGLTWRNNTNGYELGWSIPGIHATGDFQSATVVESTFEGYGRVL